MAVFSNTIALTPDPAIFGIPVDFILFGLTLLCVAVFHHHTMRVALTGLAIIAIYKIVFTGFKTDKGVMGFLFHVEHEWVILVNLLCRLMGFPLLSRHFEKSHVPVVLPKFLLRDWKDGFTLLAMVWRLSSFLDNIAAALIGGAVAYVAGFSMMLMVLGWHPEPKRRPRHGPPGGEVTSISYMMDEGGSWRFVLKKFRRQYFSAFSGPRQSAD